MYSPVVRPVLLSSPLTRSISWARVGMVKEVCCSWYLHGYRHFATAAVAGTAFVEGELLQLLQLEIDGVEALVRTCPVRKTPGYIGSAVQVDIVQDDWHPVFAQHNVLLEKVGAHGMGHRLGCQGMFGQVAAGPPMGDDNWGGRRRLGHKTKHHNEKRAGVQLRALVA